MNDSGIDYNSLPYERQRELDVKAYAKYYCSFSDDSEDADDFSSQITFHRSPLTFNSWYGTDLHKKYIQPYLRKHKLEKIKKAVI